MPTHLGHGWDTSAANREDYASHRSFIAMGGLTTKTPSHNNSSARQPERKRSGGRMANTKTLINQTYTAFNNRDIDVVFALMTDDVTWPNALEGGRLAGKEEIRAYWTRQWAQLDPHVDPLDISEEDGSNIQVRVHQIIKSLEGQVLLEREVLHVFTLKNDLIAAMHIGDDAGSAAAFAHQS